MIRMNAYASPSPLPPPTCSELVEPIKGGEIYEVPRPWRGQGEGYVN